MRLRWVDGIMMAGLVFLVVGVGMEYGAKTAPTTEVELIRGSEAAEGKTIMVDIGGAVMAPGVYEMKAGDRIKDVLVKAGGLAAEADRDWVEKNINQAEDLWDGEKLYVPKSGQILGSSNKPITNNQISNKINLNTASREELEALPGIGPAMAERIIEYRKINSGFRNVEEIKLVKGIGEKIWEEIKEMVRL